MQTLWTQIRDALWNVFNRPTFTDFLDILIVAFLLYGLLMLARQTRASAVLKGLVVLILGQLDQRSAGADGDQLDFAEHRQQRRRRAGDPVPARDPQGAGAAWARRDPGQLPFKRPRRKRVYRPRNHQLPAYAQPPPRRSAAWFLSRRVGLKDIIETGTQLDSRISSALLENIFEPNTPLHDGAVVIRGTRVMSAGCILTLAEGMGISRELGTRHRAALGITETTDAVTLIVSEETGIISVAREGRLTRHLDRLLLEQVLYKMYHQRDDGLWSMLFGRSKKQEKGEEA